MVRVDADFGGKRSSVEGQTVTRMTKVPAARLDWPRILRITYGELPQSRCHTWDFSYGLPPIWTQALTVFFTEFVFGPNRRKQLMAAFQTPLGLGAADIHAGQKTQPVRPS